MNEELKKILDDARSRGFTIEQLKDIVVRYNQKNKVVKQEVETVDSTVQTTPVNQDIQKNDGMVGERMTNRVMRNPRTFNPNEVPTTTPSITEQKLRNVELEKNNIDNIANEELLKKEYIDYATKNYNLAGKDFVYSQEGFEEYKKSKTENAPSNIVTKTISSIGDGLGQLLGNTITGISGFFGAEENIPIEIKKQQEALSPILNRKAIIDEEYSKLQSTLNGNNKALEIQKNTGKDITNLTLDEMIPKTEHKYISESTRLAEFKKNSADVLNMVYGRLNYLYNENENNFNTINELYDKINTVQDINTKNSLISQYNDLISNPSIKEYFALQEKANKLTNEVTERLKSDFTSATKDIEENENKPFIDKVIENTGGKLLAGVLSLPYRAYTIATGEKPKEPFLTYDMSQGIQDYLEQNSKFKDKYNTPNFYNETDYKGFKLLVDNNGRAYSVRDANLNEVEGQDKLLSEWNNLENKTNIESKFNKYSTLASTSQVVSDMIPLFAGGYVTKGDKIAATLLGGSTIVAQTQNDIYDSVKDRTDLNEREKNAYAMAVSTALAGLNMAVTPKFELNLLGVTSNSEKNILKKIISDNAVKYANGEITAMQVAKEYAKYFIKNASKETIQEVSEEWLYEPIVQNIVTDITNKATGSNIEMQKIDSNTFKDMLIPTVLSTGLMSGMSSYRSKNELQLESLNEAVNNVERFNQITNVLVSNGAINEQKATETKNVVSKIANTLEQANITDETDRRNLTNLLFQNETIRVRMDGNISDDLKNVYKKQIANNQTIIDKLLNNEEVSTAILEENKLEVPIVPETKQEIVTNPKVEQKEISILERKIELGKTLGEDVSDLENQLKTKQDAIQIKSTNETMLRPQQLELGLSEVEQGNQEPKVTTEQSSKSKEEVKVEEVTQSESNPALSSVESTAKALEGKNTGLLEAPLLDKIASNAIIGKSAKETIAEEYHKDKKAGNETELVKAVESLLSKEQTPTALRDVEIGGGIKNNTKDSDFVLPINEVDKLRKQKQTDLATGNAIELDNKINKEGLKESAVITYYPNEGVAELTDGHTRLDVLKDNGAKNIPIRIVEKFTDAPESAKAWNPPTKSESLLSKEQTTQEVKAEQTTVLGKEEGSGGGGDVETKQQIENFGVNKEDVEPVHSVISQVFNGLKNAGLTAAKTVGDWVGIGKGGVEKPYTLKMNGKDVQVKNTSPDVVNGFYSPLEKIISETKIDKLPAKQWIDKFAKGEEAKWTGLTDWLNQQQGSVSKADIQQYLKDNRIQVVEVVKGAEEKQVKYKQLSEMPNAIYGYAERFIETGDKKFLSEIEKEGYKVHYDNNGEVDYFTKEGKTYLKDTTKFSQYQLEGEKENYKEVLVTMPISKSKQEYVVEQDYRIPNTFYAVNQKTGVKLKFGSYELAKSQAERLSREEQPDFEKQFKSSHFDEPNILVHLRMNTRTDADGNKVLFLEEVQSDWGQQGKKEGFVGDKQKELFNQFKYEALEVNGKILHTYSSADGEMVVSSSENKENARKNAEEVARKNAEFLYTREVPTAPFVTDTNAWTKLGLKVALKEAVKQGADKIAWTTGEQQNERYDLSKQVQSISYEKKSKEFSSKAQEKGQDLYSLYIETKESGYEQFDDLTISEVEGYVGKDIANKIQSNEGSKENLDTSKGNKKVNKLTGIDLKVGGKGMKGFYGSPTEGSLGIVGNVAKSLFKQEPKTTKIQNSTIYVILDKNGKDIWNGDKKELDALLKFQPLEEGERIVEPKSPQHSIDITPEMRKQVETEGQPLFKDAEAQYRIESGKNIVEAIKDFNGSPRATVALTHEIMHPTVVAIIDGAKEGNEVGTKHTETIVSEFNKANPNSKVTTEDLIKGNDAFKDGTTSKQYRQVQEFIAKSWEKYHREGGKGFSEQFQKVLEQITQAFQSVYKSLTGKQLTPELRKMFDEILGKEQSLPPQEAKAEQPTVSETPPALRDVESTAKRFSDFISGGRLNDISDNFKVKSFDELKSLLADQKEKFDRKTRMGQKDQQLRQVVWDLQELVSAHEKANEHNSKLSQIVTKSATKEAVKSDGLDYVRNKFSQEGGGGKRLSDKESMVLNKEVDKLIDRAEKENGVKRNELKQATWKTNDGYTVTEFFENGRGGTRIITPKGEEINLFNNKYKGESGQDISYFPEAHKSESLLSKEQSTSTNQSEIEAKKAVTPTEPTAPKVKLNPKQSWMKSNGVLKVLNTFELPINLAHRIASYFISGGYVNKKSIEKEVGISTNDIKGLKNAYRVNGGMTIEKLAETLEQEDASTYNAEQSPYGDMQEYRNAIIDFFSTYMSLKDAVNDWVDIIDESTQEQHQQIFYEEDENYFENLKKETDIYEEYLSTLSIEQLNQLYNEYEETSDTNSIEQDRSGTNNENPTGTTDTGAETTSEGLGGTQSQVQNALVGKDKIAQGLQELAQIIGATQNITGDNPKLIDALSKIGIGLIEEGLATIDNVIEKIKEQIGNLNINIDDYKDAILLNMPVSKEQAIKNLVEKWKSDGLSNDDIKKILSESKTGSAFIDKIFPPQSEERSFTRALDDLDNEVEAIAENQNYIPTTNKAQEEVADNFIKENGADEATKMLLDNNMGNLSDAEINVVAMKLIKLNNANKNYKESARIFDEVAEKLTEAGRLIQTASLWNMMNPQGAVEYALRLQSKGRVANQKVVEAEVKTIQEKITEIAKDINSSKEIREAIAKMFTKRERVSKTKSQKAIDWLESIKVKDVAFSALPGVNLLPATYNTAINIIQTGIKANIALNTAVEQAVKYIRDNITADEKFNENSFKKFILDNLPKIKEDSIKIAQEELGKKISEIVDAHYTIKNEYKKSLLESILSKTDLTEEEAKIIEKIVEDIFTKEADKKLSSLEKKQKNQAKKLDEKIAKLEADIKAIENGTYKKEKEYPRIKSEKQLELEALRKQKRELLGSEQPYVKVIDRINKGKISNNDMKELLYADIGLSNIDEITISKIEELQQKINDAPEGSAEQRNRMVDLMDFIDKQINGTDNWAIAKSLLYTSMLSGTGTHVANITSNSFQMLNELWTLAWNNILLGDINGASRLIKGMIVGLERGLIEAKEVIKTGYDPNKKVLLLDNNPKITKRDILESYSGNIKPISWAKFVRRAMVAADTLFYYGNKEMSSYALASKIGRESRLKGKELQDKINSVLMNGDDKIKEFKAQAIKEGYLLEQSQRRRIFELIEANRDELLTSKADKFALKATYNNTPQGFFGILANSIQNSVSTIDEKSKILGLIATSIFPFTRVPANVISESFNYTPIGLARAFTKTGHLLGDSQNQDNIDKDDRIQLMIKSATGMLISAGILALALGQDDEDEWFDITANGYGTSYKNSSLYPLGWKPYTIGIKGNDGNWIRYNYMKTPFGILLGMIGTVIDGIKYNKDIDNIDRAGLFFSTTSNQIFNASALQGASTLFDALGNKDSDNVKKLMEYTIAKAKTPIPNILKEAYNVFDNNLYDKSTVKGIIVNNVPIIQILGKPKLNVFGEPIKKSKYGALLLLPKTDNTLKRLYDVDVIPSMPLKNKKIYGEEMNNEQFYEYVKVRGQKLRELTEENMDYITNNTNPKKAYDEIENRATNYAEDKIYKIYFKQ